MEAARQQQRLLTSLEGRGVTLARGRGTPGQRLSTALVVAAVPWVAYLEAPANPWLWWMLPAVLVTVDFLSGLVHWLFDTRIAPGPGPLGRAAVNFLDHHLHPGRSAQVGFAATTWRVALYVATPLLLLSLALPPGVWQAWVFWLGALSLVVAQAHKQAHRRRPAPVVRALQRCGLCLTARHHRRHHQDHGSAYCVFTGWCNGPLDRMGFWRRLDRLLDRRRA